MKVLVRNHGNFVKHIRNLVLYPGTNEVSKKDLDNASTHPLFDRIVESGEIEILGDDITKLKVPEAKKTIQDTFIIDMLEDWKEKETRVTLKKEIEQQIEKLTKDSKSKEDDNFF